jgi:hypothetical protein
VNNSSSHSLMTFGFASALIGICACGDSGSGTGGAGTTTSGNVTTTSAASMTTTGAVTSVTSGVTTTTTGAGGAMGDPSCATTGKNLLLCDDFEAEADGAAPNAMWTVDKGTGATVLIDSTDKKYGAHSLHLHTLPTSNKALLHETKTFPLPNGMNSFYGRAFFKVGANVNFPANHTNFFEGDGPVGNVMGNYRYGESGGKFLANYNPGDPTKGSATVIPTGWNCFEWAFLGDTNELHFYINETELMDVAVPPTGVNGTVWTAPKFNSAYFGWITFTTDNASPAYDVWYDNLAIDTARIHCDK